MLDRSYRRGLALALLLFVGLAPALAQQAALEEPVDEAAVEVIRKHGLEQSRVMEHLGWLTDVHGPRLTGSPALMEASRWILSQLEAWGLQNAHLEPWGPFGRGWTLNTFWMQARGAAVFPVHAYPKAWSPSVSGSAEVILFDAETDEQFEGFTGRLAGKVVMMEPAREVEEPFAPYARRRTPEELLGQANWAGEAPGEDRQPDPERLRQRQIAQRRMQMLADEQPLALLDRSYKGDYGTIFVSSVSVPAPEGTPWFDRPSGWDPRGQAVIPQFTLAVEHYNRLYRLLRRGLPVTLDLALDVTFHDDDPMQYNVVAEIPGADPAVGDELVMGGAHLDSWHAGTGATDNAAGSAVMMEVMRILKETYAELGRQPRRTLRIALWTGEEQGLYGSRAYVNDHFATIAGWGRPPSELKPDHARFSAYYNLDNGTGKIRGVYLQGNEAVAPLFRAWLRPFHDLEAATLTLANTGGTDHLAFDAAGLPGFQFIQDHVAYSSRTHHSNMDVYDHALADDLKQAATIIAAFVYHTAERADRLPRKPLPMPEDEQVGGSR